MCATIRWFFAVPILLAVSLGQPPTAAGDGACGTEPRERPIVGELPPRGYLGVELLSLAGCAYDPDHPDVPVRVRICRDGELIAEPTADGARPELVKVCRRPDRGFTAAVAPVGPGAELVYSAAAVDPVTGATVALPGSPRVLRVLSEGADVAVGTADADWLHGAGGDDRLDGGVGSDDLLGGAGDDELAGGRGRDRLAGGEGDDLYLYRPGDGDDTILDRQGLNRLRILHADAGEVSQEVVGDDLLVTVDAGGERGTIRIVDEQLPCGGCGVAVEVDDRPNVVLIMVDDLGWGDLGSYGQSLIATPELDAMAGEGMRFTQFYSAAPHCAPARNSLLTGLHTGHVHIRFEEPLSTDGPILPERLADAGYVTGMFGKWGLSAVDGSDVPVQAVPSDLGFGEFTGQLTHRDAHAYYLDSPPSPPGTPEHPYYPDIRQFLYRIAGGETVPLEVPPDRYVHDELVDRTLDFIDRHQGRLFFLYLPYTLPHAELVVPEDSLAPYLDAEGNSIFPEIPWTPPLDGAGFDRHNPHPRATYAGMVSRLSRDVGRILKRLRDLDLGRDTLVIFTSDNGPHDAGGIVDPSFFASTGGLSGRKWQLAEGGIRVPMIAWWPGTVVPREVRTPTALPDLYPTVLDVAGVAAGDVDGDSLRPILEGTGYLPLRPLYWETHNPRAVHRQAVRKGRYKLRRPKGGAPLELFDLAVDPTESTNLAADPALCPVLLDLIATLNAAHQPSPIDPDGRYDIPPLPLECPGGG